MAHELLPPPGRDDFRLDGLRVRPRGIHRAVGTCHLFQHRFEREVRVAHGLMLVVGYTNIVYWPGDDALGEMGLEVLDDAGVVRGGAADEKLVDLLARREEQLKEPLVLFQDVLRGDLCHGGDGVGFGHAAVETLVDELLRFVVAEHLSRYTDGRELAKVVVSAQEVIYDRLVDFSSCC